MIQFFLDRQSIFLLFYSENQYKLQTERKKKHSSGPMKITTVQINFYYLFIYHFALKVPAKGPRESGTTSLLISRSYTSTKRKFNRPSSS